MSGPIVRKYGFPNFDKIFGERELQHGVEDSEEGFDTTSEAAASKKETAAGKPTPKAKKKKS